MSHEFGGGRGVRSAWVPWALVVVVLIGGYFARQRSDEQYRMAYGGYILAAVVAEGPNAGRYLFCCRSAEVMRAQIPDGATFRVEFATKDEAASFIRSHGTYGQWVRTDGN